MDHLDSKFKDNKEELLNNGITILQNIYDDDIILDLRKQILDNLSLMKQTRKDEDSRHLAAFHRYPEFEKLHGLVSCNETVLQFLDYVLDGKKVRSIGNDDITVNRSQHWHKDLLRGKYSTHLNSVDNIWSKQNCSVFRILLYLQDTSSLKIVKGSHLKPISLQNDDHAIPSDDDDVAVVTIKKGDIGIMDIRTTHRGATKEFFDNEYFKENKGILIATVLGEVDSKLTDNMEKGNFHRLMNWMERNP